MVSCLLQNMQVNNYCLIRLKSSHPRHNTNAKPCAGDLWRKVPRLLPCVKWLKGCLLDAVVAPKEGSLLDGVDPVFRIWVNDSMTQLLLLPWSRTTQATGFPGSRASQKMPSALQTSKTFFPHFPYYSSSKLVVVTETAETWHYLNDNWIY